MGTHPIFESDFDCLTEIVSSKNEMSLTLLSGEHLYFDQARCDVLYQLEPPPRTHNIPVQLFLTKLRLFFDKKPTVTNSDDDALAFVDIFRNLRNNIFINCIVRVEYQVKNSSTWNLAYSINEPFTELSSAECVTAFKIITHTDLFLFKPKSQLIHIKILNQLIKLLSQREKSLTPISLYSPLFINPEQVELDSRQYWESFIRSTTSSNDQLEVHAKNAEFKCRSYPKYNVKPVQLKDEFFATRSTFYQDNRFLRWHYAHQAAHLYSCGGTSVQSTRETQQGHGAMMDKLSGKLNALVVDVTLAQTQQGQSDLLFESIRQHKTNKEMDRYFITTYTKSALPLVVCSALNKAFNIVMKMNHGHSVIITETSETNAPMYTSIVASLVQIIIDDKYRQLEGFLDLIDREWMLLGHDFGDLYGWMAFIEAVNHLFVEIDFHFNRNILPLFLHAPRLGLFEQFAFKNARHRTQKFQQHGVMAMASFGYFVKNIAHPLFLELKAKPMAHHGSVQDMSSIVCQQTPKKTPIKRLKLKLKSLSRKNVMLEQNPADHIWFVPHMIKISAALSHLLDHRNSVFDFTFDKRFAILAAVTASPQSSTSRSRHVHGPFDPLGAEWRLMPPRPGLLWDDDRGRKFLSRQVVD